MKLASSQKQMQNFTKHLLTDVKALERMLDAGLFEIDVTRIGAEQEFCLVDRQWKPAPLALEILDLLHNDQFTTELAKFNLEVNLTPIEFKNNCLSSLEGQLNNLLNDARQAANTLEADIILTGILPTIRKYDIGLDNLTPRERYYALCKAINKLRGSEYELRLRGIDELSLKHDSPLLEACNTGFQVHIQVSPDEYVDMYNIAQALAGPILAACTNSPLLFGKRLWKESRVALFQQSIDTRKSSHHLREMSARVTFGNSWLKDSILNIYKEDIVRYRILLSSDITENVFEKIESGEAPELLALKIHNSTVYRWNRPCYGISKGKAHLRIENRILPSGPSVLDEIANAALWLGAMRGLMDEFGDITKKLDFDDARSNFVAAARLGLDTKLDWFGKTKVNASNLIKEELLPLAESGLKKANIAEKDIAKYLGVIEERVTTARTGSQWILASYTELAKETKKDEMLSAITASIVSQQQEGKPVHQWDLASLSDIPEWEPTKILVEEFMTTYLFTVRKDDILELVSEMMDWRNIRYVLVEDQNGRLVGLISSGLLLKYYANNINHGKGLPDTVKSVMIKDPITIAPEASIIEAVDIFQKYKIGCIPVVNGDKLVGAVTEQNFLNLTGRLLKRLSKKKG